MALVDVAFTLYEYCNFTTYRLGVNGVSCKKETSNDAILAVDENFAAHKREHGAGQGMKHNVCQMKPPRVYSTSQNRVELEGQHRQRTIAFVALWVAHLGSAWILL